MIGLSYTSFAATLLVVYFAVKRFKRYLRLSAIIKEHNCEPVKRFPQKEYILGYEVIRDGAKHSKNRTSLAKSVEDFSKLGTTFQVNAFGMTTIATIDPEIIKTVLATNFKDYGIGYRLKIFGPLLGTGIFTTDGLRWEHSRAMVRPNFTRAQVADLEAFEVHVLKLMNRIPRDGSTFDIQSLFFQLTLDSATEFLFGESVDSLRDDEDSKKTNDFAEAFDIAQIKMGKRAEWGPFMDLYRNREFTESCQKVHKYVDRFVEKALRHREVVLAQEKKGQHSQDLPEEEKYIFLQELAKSTSDPQQLRDEILNILVAGRDTTAGLLSNTFHVLARRPDLWRRLQAEVATLDGSIPDYETLKDMRFLKHLLSESLRLYPVVPFNARFAIKDNVLPRGGGPDGSSPVCVPAGTIVAYSLFAMHRREDIYGDDAAEFNPDRWEGSLRPGWGYLPFNGGPRICVGQQFALAEASYTIVRLCQAFIGIECRDMVDGAPAPWVEGYHMTLSCGDGVKISLIPRTG